MSGVPLLELPTMTSPHRAQRKAGSLRIAAEVDLREYREAPSLCKGSYPLQYRRNAMPRRQYA